MNILIISLDGLKETFLSLPAVRGLRKTYPQSKIFLLSDERSSEASHLIPFVDRVVSLPLSFFPNHFFSNLFFNEDGKKEKDSVGEKDSSEVQSLHSGISKMSLYEKNFLYRLFYEESFIDHLGYQEKEDFIKFKSQMKEILNISWDQLINFSSHSLSGWLSFFIQSVNQVGLRYNSQGLASFGNSWLRYKNKVNQFNISQRKDLFHPSDIYYYGSGIRLKKEAFHLEAMDSGKSEAKKCLNFSFKKFRKLNLESYSFHQPHFVLFQPFSEKDRIQHEDLVFFKDLIKKSYKNLLFVKNPYQSLNQNSIKGLNSSFLLNSGFQAKSVRQDIFFLLADDNHSKSHYLKILEALCLKEKIPVSFMPLSLESLLSLANDSILSFVRGNTVLQKMNSFTKCKTIEFYWKGEAQNGSSFCEGSFIIEARKNTFELAHFISFVLSEALLTEDLFLLEEKLKFLSQQFEDQMIIYKTLFNDLDFCIQWPLLLMEKAGPSLKGKEFLDTHGVKENHLKERNFLIRERSLISEGESSKYRRKKQLQLIQDCFERLSWKLYFEKEHLKNLNQLGSESLKALDLLKNLVKEKNKTRSLELLSKMEDQTSRLSDSFEKVIRMWLSALRNKDETHIDSFLTEWKKIEDSFREYGLLDHSRFRSSSFKKEDWSLLPKKINEGDLSFLRAIQTQIDDYSKTNKIQLKLIRSAKLHLKEEVVAYEKMD